jgi:hypothetical protein
VPNPALPVYSGNAKEMDQITATQELLTPPNKNGFRRFIVHGAREGTRTHMVAR